VATGRNRWAQVAAATQPSSPSRSVDAIDRLFWAAKPHRLLEAQVRPPRPAADRFGRGRDYRDCALSPLFVDDDALFRQRLPPFTAPVAAAFMLAERDTRSGTPVILVNDNS
jgi:hypothetical protein